MLLFKFIAKIFILPVLLAVIVIQWTGIFLTGLAGAALGILSALFSLVAGATFLLSLASREEALKLLTVGFVLFILPRIAEWIVIRITALRCHLADFIRS